MDKNNFLDKVRIAGITVEDVLAEREKRNKKRKEQMETCINKNMPVLRMTPMNVWMVDYLDLEDFIKEVYEKSYYTFASTIVAAVGYHGAIPHRYEVKKDRLTILRAGKHTASAVG